MGGQKRLEEVFAFAVYFLHQVDRCIALRWIQQRYTHEQTPIMQMADRATDSGNHHDPPTANHVADAATATIAKIASGR